MSADYHWVADSGTLAGLCRDWQYSPVLALDTEFIRTDTFYPRPGLLQCSVGADCYLLDPLAIDDFAPLAELFQDPDITKVLHAPGEDLEVFDRLLGVLPSPLLDTQVGAALAGHDFSLSYQRLCETLLGETVEKGETRSDWLQRPLTPGQCHYAALDVAWLPQLAAQLQRQLADLGRLSWWEEEGELALAGYRQLPAPEQYYRKVKGAWRLDALGLAVLAAVITWREYRARERNIPRSWLLKDSLALDIAERRPQQLDQLRALGVAPKTLQREGETLLKVIHQALALPADQRPPALAEPLPRALAPLLKALKKCARERAGALQLPLEILVRNRDYEALLQDWQPGRPVTLPPSLQGWRRPVVADALVAILDDPGHSAQPGSGNLETP